MRNALMLGLSLSLLSPNSFALEGRRADSVLLNGTWQYALGEGTEEAQTSEGQAKLQWTSVTLPGRFMAWDSQDASGIRFVWARRTFEVSPQQAKRTAVLRWDRIVHGATAFINGRQVGYNEPTGPYQVLVPAGVLRPNQNEIVLKIAGAGGVRKARSGHFLFPAGQIWGPSRPDLPTVAQDIWIDFADGGYMKWVLALPDLAHEKVRLRVTPTGLERRDGLTITARVRPWPQGAVVGSAETPAQIVPQSDPLGGEAFHVDVALPNFKPWTPEDRQLYLAEVTLRAGEHVLDAAEVRFGMREIRVVNGDYQLNGRRLWIRGSNLVHEWDWADVIKGKEQAYLVTEAREMSMNAFRTHTQPPPRLWADICDEGGTMILAEFPVLYNYRDHKYTPDEWEIFHRNAQLDTAGWMARLWNHPAVIMWVLSNESRTDNEWEAGPFHEFVTSLDPTRPTMRTGTTGTVSNYDVHTCGNTNHWTHEGQMHVEIDQWFRDGAGRTVTNSEYMNIFDRPKCQWTGNEDEEADRLAYAQLGMEHTEAMRRARVDAILPYMYAGWTRTRRGEVWRGNFAQPVSACWHSALSPVLASLDLFDANYLQGQAVNTDLYLINDSWQDAHVHVDLLLTDECPQFLPEAGCFDAPRAKWSFDFDLKADTLRQVPVQWKLPDQAGSYWLTARTTGIPGRPVLSQRFVRAVTRPTFSSNAPQRTILVLGADATWDAFCRNHSLVTTHLIDDLSAEKHLVLVWNPNRLTDKERQSAARLGDFAAAGGRIVVLATKKWNWNELCDIRVASISGSRVFAYDGVQHPLLTGIDLQGLQRWNGVPGTVAIAAIEGPALAGGDKLLWVREPKNAVVAEIPATHGKGSVLFSQLALRDHVNPDAANYDPVAEQMLVNLLSWK